MCHRQGNGHSSQARTCSKTWSFLGRLHIKAHISFLGNTHSLNPYPNIGRNLSCHTAENGVCVCVCYEACFMLCWATCGRQTALAAFPSERTRVLQSAVLIRSKYQRQEYLLLRKEINSLCFRLLGFVDISQGWERGATTMAQVREFARQEPVRTTRLI